VSRLFLAQIDELSKKIAELERATVQEAAHAATTRRLQTMPGVGPITAMAIETFAPPMGFSAAAATSRPGSVSSPSNIQPAANRSMARLRKRVSATSGGC
jgi:transposase